MRFLSSKALCTLFLAAASFVHASPEACADPSLDAAAGGIKCNEKVDLKIGQVVVDAYGNAVEYATANVEHLKDTIQLAKGRIPGTEHNPVRRLNEDDDYVLKPLDAVLFAGSDPVANFIKRIELHEVVPRLGTPFHELWTHAGILVDKTVLPLDFMEDGKMYLYESVFSGEVAGYVYSKVLPLDHKVEDGGFHLGPQIRDFAAVVAEGDSDVGIAPLSPEQREILMAKLKENPNLILDVYNQYHDFGYPITNILSVIASASQKLHKDLQYFGSLTKEYFPSHVEEKTAVFCSELVSIIYKTVGFKTWADASPDTFTPLAVEVAPEFQNVIYYAKEDGVQHLHEPHTKITSQKRTTKAERSVASYEAHARWAKMEPLGGVPSNAVQVGTDVDGKPLYAARAKIGKGYYLGKIRGDSAYPYVTYFEREIPVNFGHEVLTSLDGFEFVDAKNGEIPEGAVPMGLDDDGVTVLYMARGTVGAKRGFLGFGAEKGAFAPGMIHSNLTSAKIGFDKDEVEVYNYQVLVRKA
ncbi:hypothetical protein HDU78_006965 [Chytriomyces hyalinus]|nr:hypothetical protein HDU78_006965 [Chytriomyces hyalinus]